MTRTPQLEIVAQDPAGARIAVANGADRIELCQALSTGGMTPSLGILDAAITAVGADKIAVLVRPRGGGFVYDAEEVDVVTSDVRACADRGVAGVVVGALTDDFRVDVAAMSAWMAAAGECEVVFHRAIDVLPDPVAALDDLIALGVTRVLTSGGAPVSIQGAATLRRMVEHAAGRIQIQVGGGVTVADIPELVATGVDAVHLSARTTSAHDAPSGPGGGATGFDVTDAAVVSAAAQALRG